MPPPSSQLQLQSCVCERVCVCVRADGLPGKASHTDCEREGIEKESEDYAEKAAQLLRRREDAVRTPAKTSVSRANRLQITRSSILFFFINCSRNIEKILDFVCTRREKKSDR